MAHAGGRPLMYSDPKELEAAVNDYFENPTRFRTIYVADHPVKIPLFTIVGLALHLGFDSRQSLYNYKERPEFMDILKRATTLIEREYEEKLQNQACTGSIFALKNMGWKDKTEVEQSGTATTIQIVRANEATA